MKKIEEIPQASLQPGKLTFFQAIFFMDYSV